jgi:hypothetical protein
MFLPFLNFKFHCFQYSNITSTHPFYHLFQKNSNFGLPKNLEFYFSPLMRKNFSSTMRSMIHQKEFILKNSEYTINYYYVYDQYHFIFDKNDFNSFHNITNIFTDYEILNIQTAFF